MPLDPEQAIRMALGGTIGLPSAYPTIGSVTLDVLPANVSAGHDSLVHVTQKKSPSHANIWIVRAGDIAAIEEKPVVNPVDENGNPVEPTWHVGLDAVLARLESGSVPVKGITYVGEEASVLLRLEYGLSAGEAQRPRNKPA